MAGLLHIVASTLRADAAPDALARALTLARGLWSADGAECVVTGRSDERLVVATWLTGLDALEPFAASPQHMEFVMRGIAPVTATMWSASVATNAPPRAEADLMWVFAISAADDVYEWQVRDLLDELRTLPGAAAAGPTVEERERYRAAGAVCLTTEEAGGFEAALRSMLRRWGEVAGAVEQALVPVLR